ncbi:hypothetical protein CNECB9_3760087 [Cupriavidus necator]|uniref:TniQ protein n=1 Tax=Cupriavidus necator TaxID=106590 RepID=A0A1K0IJP5_CUPNE|nr:hypothetical protein CNECB9_3760087 [Cupriavidus necator]
MKQGNRMEEADNLDQLTPTAWLQPLCPGNRRESLWWMTHRFLVLNRPTPAEAYTVLGAPRKDAPARSLLTRAPRPERHQRRALWIVWERLCAVSGAHPLPLHAPVRNLACLPPADVAWYCQACLAAGFHSAWVSGVLLERCPIHAQPLRCACPQCGEPLPTGFRREIILAPGRCVCGWRFMTVDCAVHGPLDLPGLHRLDAYVVWLHEQAAEIAHSMPSPEPVDRWAPGPIWRAWRAHWAARLPDALRATQQGCMAPAPLATVRVALLPFDPSLP